MQSAVPTGPALERGPGRVTPRDTLSRRVTRRASRAGYLPCTVTPAEVPTLPAVSYAFAVSV